MNPPKLSKPLVRPRSSEAQSSLSVSPETERSTQEKGASSGTYTVSQEAELSVEGGGLPVSTDEKSRANLGPLGVLRTLAGNDDLDSGDGKSTQKDDELVSDDGDESWTTEEEWPHSPRSSRKGDLATLYTEVSASTSLSSTTSQPPSYRHDSVRDSTNGADSDNEFSSENVSEETDSSSWISSSTENSNGSTSTYTAASTGAAVAVETALPAIVTSWRHTNSK